MAPAAEKTRVSVIIATYGREEVLCDTIRQVLSEPYGNKELIVVDQTEEHTAETVAYLDSVASGIRYFRMDHPSVTEAENLGIREATGDIVLFLDDDVAFEPGLIASHVRNYSDETIIGVGGIVVPQGHAPVVRLPRGCSNRRTGYFFFRHDYTKRVAVSNVLECNASFRRSVLLDVGPIDENFRENAYLWGMDLCLRLVKTGGRIVHDPKAGVTHLLHRKGGVRMRSVKPLSFFRNLFYFLNRHHRRHERFSIAVRSYFFRVIVSGWRQPWSIPVNTMTFLRAWLTERKSRPDY